jgi:hypothetical protein
MVQIVNDTFSRSMLISLLVDITNEENKLNAWSHAYFVSTNIEI